MARGTAVGDARMTTYFEIAAQLVEWAYVAICRIWDGFPALRNNTAPIRRASWAYKKQTAPLEAVIANVKTHGPF